MKTRSLAAALALSALAPHARAIEPGKLGEDEVRIDVTESSSVIYNFDNRDDAPHDVASRANDEWGMWYNRLNIQST